MIWKAKHPYTEYEQGKVRPLNVFAYLPTLIGDNIVWLQCYQILQVYHIKEYPATIDNKTVAIKARGEWVNTMKRLVPKEV